VFRSSSELLDASGDLPYPVVVKPATKEPGSLAAAFRADSPAAVEAGPRSKAVVVVQPFVPEPLWAVAGVVHEGRLVAAVHQRYLRTWPSACGTASAAVTAPPNREVEERLPALLAPYEGVFQVQFAGRFLLDVNPRIYGSLPLAVAAGTNLPAIWCDLVGGTGGGDAATVRARPGVFYRWLEGDVRNLVEAARRGDVTPAAALARLRPRRGTAHSTEAIADPGPMLARLGYAVRRARARSA
jgi:predicted ATP-grasp superfamily ATP-dependent carboligase